MTKTIIKEIIIALLTCLAILLILSVAFYNFIPANKVVPEAVEYAPSKEIQTQLNTAVEDSKEIIVTYEVTAQDLDNYERTNEYNPGKANPFAPIKEEIPDEPNGDNNSNGSVTQEPIKPTTPGTSNNSSQGSLFENGSSK